MAAELKFMGIMDCKHFRHNEGIKYRTSYGMHRKLQI